MQVSAAEFMLEGLYAHKRISRNEERGFTAEEKPSRKQDASRKTRRREADWVRSRKSRRSGTTEAVLQRRQQVRRAESVTAD